MLLPVRYVSKCDPLLVFREHVLHEHPLTSLTPSPPSHAAAQEGTTGLVWFKSTDLRLLDHEPLSVAHRENTRVLHAFCFDPRWFGPVRGAAAPGTLKTGPRRATFLWEAVEDLRGNLRARGSDLLVRIGRPEVEIVKLARTYKAKSVYCHR